MKIYTLIGFYKSVDQTLAAISAMADQHITISGDDVTVPQLNQLLGVLALATNLDQVQIRSPSLRRMLHKEIGSYVLGESPSGINGGAEMFQQNPIPLEVGEKLNFFAANSGAGAAQDVFGVLFLGDGPITPIVNRPIHSVKVTVNTAPTANVWSLSALTFDQDLPVGRYEIVGAGCFEPSCIACRFVIPQDPWRAGVICTTEGQCL